MSGYRLFVLATVLAGCVALAGEPVAIKSMRVEIAKADGEGKQTYVVAPDALTEVDVAGGKAWRVSLPDPAPLKPWCQHVGLILTLAKPIPAGTPWRVSGKARSISGAKGLSVLRRWGSSTPWTHVALTEEWAPFAIDRVSTEHETEFIAISLVANPKRRLQPAAEGIFELQALTIEIVDKVGMNGKVEADGHGNAVHDEHGEPKAD